MEIIGIDVGFGFTKASNGRSPLIFKSILGEPTDIPFSTGLGDADPTANLHVTVDDHTWFVGDLAVRQSVSREFTLDQDRLVKEFVPALALAAAGRHAEEGITLNVVSGLPVGFLKKDYEKLISAITGSHKVVYHTPGVRDEVKEFTIHAVQVMPQPLGAVFDLLMDEHGRLANRELPTQKIGVVDIGFRTTDFSVFDRLQYVDRASSTVELGMARCFSAIAETLKRESGVTVELYRLYDAMRSGFIRIKGHEYNITHLRDRIFERAASEIAGELNRLWGEDWDMDAVIISGGGGAVLSDFIAPKLDFPLLAANGMEDPRFQNVNGYLKFGRSLWKKPPVPMAPVAEPAKSA